MATGTLAFHMLARHGQAIAQLKRDMAAEPDQRYLLDFLGYEAANFVYAFLLASGNRVSLAERAIRDDLQAAILAVLTRHGIDPATFVVWPEVHDEPPAAQRHSV